MKRPKNPMGGLPEWVIAARIQNEVAANLRRDAGIPVSQISAIRPTRAVQMAQRDILRRSELAREYESRVRYDLKPSDKPLVDTCAAMMKGATPTGFALEGMLVAIIRAKRCASGWRYPWADASAREIVRRALHLAGWQRPTVQEGQRYFVRLRTNCLRCDAPLTGGDVFCSDHCSALTYAERIRRHIVWENEWVSFAHRALARQKIEPRNCAHCDKEFTPRTPGARLCPEHQNSERVNAIPEKLCATCGEPFRGKTREAIYCSRECNPVTHRKLEDRACSNPTCGRYFRPRNAEQIYCSMSCYREGSRGPRIKQYGLAA